MAREFDLFGNPVPANKGSAGRNEHAADPEIYKKIRDLRASGWTLQRISEEIGLSVPTMRKHYFPRVDASVRQARAEARDELRGLMMIKLREQVEAGNVSAIKAMKLILDEEDLRDRVEDAQAAAPGKVREAPVPKGKKESLANRAETAIEGNPLLRPGWH